MKTLAALGVLAIGSALQAQSTSMLGRAEREITYQLAIGGNSSLIGSGYGAQTGALRALAVSQRREFTGSVDLVVDGWVIQRRPSSSSPSSFVNIRYNSETRHQERLESSWLGAAILSGSRPIHLGLDLVVDPSLGLGLVPLAYGRWIDASASSSGGSSSSTGQAIVFAAGLSLRWRHLVVEQHILQVAGADGALGNGENAPLMIGWRF